MPSQNLDSLRRALKWAPELDLGDLSFLLRDYPDALSERHALDALSYTLINKLNAMEGAALGSALNAARHALLMTTVLRQLQWWQSSQTSPELLEALAESASAYLRLANAWREIRSAQIDADNARNRADYYLKRTS